MIEKADGEFNKAEFGRYSRHFVLPEFGLKGQRKLKQAKVLVVGLGGLGAPLSQYLVAAGVGEVGLLDDDIVDDSNLQRQVLYTTDDVGKSKCEVAFDRLSKLNPHIKLNKHSFRLTSENALEIISQYDVIADGTDNFQTRYLVNDASVLCGKCNVYASIFRFEGQVSVFNYWDGESFGPNYRDLFPKPPPPGMVPSCAEGGVLGVLPGIVGSLQANEVIKVLTGMGDVLSGKLMLFDALNGKTRLLKFAPRSDNPLTGDDPSITELIDYDEFCGLNVVQEASIAINQITPLELKDWFDQGLDFQLIDVREAYELQICNIGGQHIPLGSVTDSVASVRNDIPVVFYCRSGKRSLQAIQGLMEGKSFNNLLNLKGGILGWGRTVDPEMPAY